MSYLVVKRFGQMILVMVAASFLLFVATNWSGIRVEKNMLGPYATEQQYRVLREKLQLEDPLMVRYFRWMGVLFGLIPDPLGDPKVGLGFADPKRGDQYFGNFGYSRMLKMPVNDAIWPRFRHSLLLAGVALACIIPTSLILGVLAGSREGSLRDRALSLGGVITTSIPGFAMGIFLATLLVFAPQWAFGESLLPGVSHLLAGPFPIWMHYVLPVLTLMSVDVGYVMRMVRGAMVEVMTQPYIRTAVLKGLHAREVLFRHALRNAMIAPFTIFLLQILWLVDGVVVVETLFGYPGIGRLILSAAMFGDIPVVQATTIVAVVATCTTQFVGDIGYMLLNPRIRFA